MTYRERRLARAQRLQDWADKREAKAQLARSSAAEYAENMPPGQPILVGHHSENRARRERERFESNLELGVAHERKAQQMRSKAANILAATERAIYSDDPQAIEALEAKLAAMETKREAIKAYNASCRKETPDVSLLPADLQRMATIAERWPVTGRGKGGELPAFVLSNIGGNIGRTRKRLDSLKSRRQTDPGQGANEKQEILAPESKLSAHRDV